jgi:hypothetical protein
MKKILFFVCLAAFAAQAQRVELLTVRDGLLYPTNAAASVTDLANAVAQAQAAAAVAEATAAAASIISNEIAEITALENARNATGYIRGFVESFSAGIEADTNMTASIVLFDRTVTATNVWVDLYTFFSSDPGVWPVVRSTESLLRTNAWDELATVSAEVVEVQVGEVLYEAYKNRVSMPLDASNAFFRVWADVQGGGTNQFYFPVRNGISVNGQTPLTAEFVIGTNTVKYVGGVRVQ